ncbi:MAG: hypothetical protein ABJ205_08805 [Erythrobacter sp.]|uniref:hypothetical protein n=1 Tax=Erythrobacter sp. TaxID=1042 RepID=UPI003267D1AD
MTEPKETDQINRTFRDIPADKVTEEERLEFLEALSAHRGLDWDQLLESRRIMIVSEAGAGKTFECQQLQERLWDAGEPAFHLELAELADNPVDDLLTPEESERFAAWQSAQSEDATFILDSVDELQISKRSFRSALIKLAKALEGKLHLARIIVTSRPVAFDKQEMRKRLPIPKTEASLSQEERFASIAMGDTEQADEGQTDQNHFWREVALMPLSTEQMEMLASSEGVTDPKKMLAEARAQDADDYLRRPQDLIELCADWNLHGRLRRHRDQVKSNIENKLQPREDRQEKAELSQVKAWEGASRLALAAIMCRKLTIRHSKEADRELGSNSSPPIDPVAILPEWSHKEIDTLLQRPLFGFASYGRVKFQHRSAIEFLAADRLKTLRVKGLPIKTIKRMLFATTGEGIDVIKPTMRPIVGWLALENETIFDEACQREPAALVTHGDPESLSIGARRRILAALVRRFGEGEWRGIHLPHIQLARLSDPELAADIHELWENGIENHEIREILLTLIEGAKIAACADIAFEVVANAELSISERLCALDALIAVEDVRLEGLGAALATRDGAWPTRLAKSAVVRLFPEHMSVDVLCAALAVHREEADAIGDLSWSLPRLIEHKQMSPELLEALRDGLAQLIYSTATWEKDRWPHLQSENRHLIAPLVATCLKEDEDKALSVGWLKAATIALKLGDSDYQSRESIEALTDRILAASSEVRERLFWQADELLQAVKTESDPYARFANATLREHHFLDDEDREWVISFLSDSKAPTDKRAVALEAAIRLPRGDVEWVDWLKSLKEHVADNPELTKSLDKKLSATRRDRELERMARRDRQREKKAKRKDKIARASWITLMREILKNPESAFGESKAGNTIWNLWRAMRNEKHARSLSGWNRRLLEETFGKETADRVRLAMMEFWRSEAPTLRSEREDDEKNSYLVKWQLGLAGLYAEAEDASWAGHLSEEEVELALRYVPVELNRFPSWLADFVPAYSQIIERVLGSELLDELKERSDAGSISLYYIKSAPTPLARVFLPRVMNLLESAANARPSENDTDHLCSRLTKLAAIVLEHGSDEEIVQLSGLAKDALASPISMPIASTWMSVIFRTDPQSAVEQLAKYLETSPQDAIPLIGSLFGDRDNEIPISLSRGGYTPDQLLKLARVTHQHIKREDDVKRGPGTYTPDARDHAERGRYAVVNVLLSSTDPEAWPAKLALAEDPELADLKDRFFALALESAAEQSDGSVATEEEIASLGPRADLAPRTSQEFYSLMVDRLEDIDDLLLQDDSPRDTWALIKDEKLMRREIARVLKQEARHAYTVYQEGVTADEKETDIRLRSTASDQEAVIELKIGEKGRAANDLAAALRSQLVRKYMAKENCRAGCLLITTKRDRTWKHPKTGKMMDLEALVAFLTDEARQIEIEMGNQLRLFVFGLDLRPRLPTEKEDALRKR